MIRLCLAAVTLAISVMNAGFTQAAEHGAKSPLQAIQACYETLIKLKIADGKIEDPPTRVGITIGSAGRGALLCATDLPDGYRGVSSAVETYFQVYEAWVEAQLRPGVVVKARTPEHGPVLRDCVSSSGTLFANFTALPPFMMILAPTRLPECSETS